MFLGDSRRLGGPGFLPLQDHGFNYYSSLAERASVIGVRVTGRDSNSGLHIDQPIARGDMSGFMHWYKSTRPVGTWREVTPAQIEGDKVGDNTQGSGWGPAGEVPPNTRIPSDPGGSIGGGGGDSSNTPFPGNPADPMNQYPNIPVGQLGKPPKSWKWPVWQGVPNPLGGSFPWPKFGGGGEYPGVGGGGIRFDLNTARPDGSIEGQQDGPGGDGGGAKMPPESADGLTSDYNPSNEAILPTSGWKWNADKRYAAFRPNAPIDGSGNREFNSFPKNYYGLMVASTDEIGQVEYFHPTDPRLLAPNNGGSPTHGTLLADITEGNQVDVNLMAPLQSAFRVIPKPEGELVYESGKHGNTLALNIGVSGLRDSSGGLFADRAGPVPYLGHISVRAGGPIDVGPCEAHKFAKAGGVDICAGHISTQAFYRNAFDHDGPLAFEPFDWPDPGELPYKTKVHFVWNPGPKYMWPRDGGSKEAQGIWDWYSSAINTAETPGTPTNPDYGTPTTPGGEPDPGGGPTTPGGEPGPITPSGGGGGTPTGGGTGPTTTGGGVSGPTTGGGAGGSGGGDTTQRYIYPGMSGDNWERSYSSTHLESIMPSILFRPQVNDNGIIDMQHSLFPSKKSIAAWQGEHPTVLRMQAFGSRINGDWDYTQRPGNSRNKGGTADGVVMLLPPEIDGTDVGSGFVPDYVPSKSSSKFLAGPGVSIGVGVVNSSGSMTNGHYLAYDSSTGDTDMKSHDDTLIFNVDGSTNDVTFAQKLYTAGGSTLTQTYSATSATHAARTSSGVTDNTGGTAGGAVEDVSSVFNQSVLNDNFASLADEINKLRADMLNTAQFTNKAVDDLQSGNIPK